jgi:Lipid A 3-O-deacylase (PagL)
MVNNLIKTILLLILSSYIISAQFYSKDTKTRLDFGYGSSPYTNIHSEQYLLFVSIPKMNGRYEQFSYDSNVNLEYISEGNKSTYLIGLAPMLRYDIEILNKYLFISGGIGANFINNQKIGTRKTGGNFIFSDMISAGIQFYRGNNYSIELSYLFRHISNAALFKRNQGYNSQYLVVSFII